MGYGPLFSGEDEAVIHQAATCTDQAAEQLLVEHFGDGNLKLLAAIHMVEEVRAALNPAGGRTAEAKRDVSPVVLHTFTSGPQRVTEVLE